VRESRTGLQVSLVLGRSSVESAGADARNHANAEQGRASLWYSGHAGILRGASASDDNQCPFGRSKPKCTGWTPTPSWRR